MGVVWRAQDGVLGREVAVKEVVFPPTMTDQELRQAQARVLREARAAARLNHPGAVTLYDVVRDQGGTFIVMELVEAPTLADLQPCFHWIQSMDRQRRTVNPPIAPAH
jgi:serine/threonine protein kinase